MKASRRMRVAKINHAMARFEKSIEKINREIDKGSRNGKINESDDYDVNRNYVETNGTGRRWSFK